VQNPLALYGVSLKMAESRSRFSGVWAPRVKSRLIYFSSLCALLLSLSFVLSAEEAPSQTLYRGSWIASAGPKRYFRGRWSGQLLANTHNAASGTWVLLGQGNKGALEGTWSAHKSQEGWQGTWTAQIRGGRRYSGAWSADLDKFPGNTFEDMLQHVLEKQVAGWWKSGRLEGNWWLQDGSY
jgi:hypothetical protein